MYDITSSPFDYGGLTLKNRIIFSPTTLGLSEEAQAARLEAIAAGGCAMIIIGDVPVGRPGFGPDLFSKKGQAHYRRLIDAAHRHGCKVCAQLQDGRMDCAAMSRQLIADPEWPNKVMGGRVDTIQHCVRCNQACLGGLMAHQGVHCIYERKN